MVEWNSGHENPDFWPFRRIKPYLSMKKYYYSLALLAFAAIVLIPGATQAEEASVSPSASASVSASVTASPTPVPANIREKLRMELELKNQNLKANQGFRNDILEKKRMASSTASTTDKTIRRDLKEVKGDIKDVRGDFRDDVKDIKKDAKDEVKDLMRDHRNSTTSPNKQELRREIELRLFQAHKDMLVRQLNLAVTNLKQIRERISSRITKAEQSGKNMTESKALLVTADAKIVAAETAITALANFSVGTSTASTTGTTPATVKLDKPREIGDKAIKAVKEARDALLKVIVSIGRIPAPTVTATTTATTTTQ